MEKAGSAGRAWRPHRAGGQRSSLPGDAPDQVMLYFFNR